MYARLLKKKAVIEAGLLKPDSPWTPISNSGRAYYDRREPFEESLEEPAEGVKDEQACGDEKVDFFNTQHARLLKVYATTPAGVAAAAAKRESWRPVLDAATPGALCAALRGGDGAATGGLRVPGRIAAGEGQRRRHVGVPGRQRGGQQRAARG